MKKTWTEVAYKSEDVNEVCQWIADEVAREESERKEEPALYLTKMGK